MDELYPLTDNHIHRHTDMNMYMFIFDIAVIAFIVAINYLCVAELRKPIKLYRADTLPINI